MKLRSDVLVIAGSLAALVAGVLLLAPDLRGAGHDPQDLKRASSHYTTPAGGKALLELLRNLGYDARRHERELGLRPADARAIFLLAPSTRLKEEEARELVRFVEGGGTLVWAPREKDVEDPLPKAFGIAVTEADTEAGPTRFAGYALAPATRLRVNGAPAAELARGAGRVVALADARIASNRGLKEAEHATFLVHVAARAAGRDGGILFDEFHHGFQAGQSAVALLLDSPLAGAVWIGLAAAYLGVIAAGRRLGPPVDPRVERRRRTRESLDAFAGLCARLRAAPQAAGMVAAELRRFLETRAAHPDAAALKGPLAELDALSRAPRVPERELVRVFAEVERLRARLLQRRTPA